jgi:hypothetical protein
MMIHSGNTEKQNINGMKLDNINKVKHFTIRSDVNYKLYT